MAIHLIVDGYNLIRQVEELRRLERREMEAARRELVDLLSDYHQIRGHQVTIVFDGTESGNLEESRQRRKGIGIVFSSHGETADDLIVRMVTGLREGAVVVSSDREISRSIEKLGATPIASPEFMDKLENALDGDPAENGEDWEESGVRHARKGAQKKLSKKVRRARKKLDQL